MSNILLIGTGRMAHNLGHAIRKAGHTIISITGRDPMKLAAIG
ncbi:MAG: NAD(P)-binding domain-containing protein, partial [Bacteroidetes bacterium]|nr:NAD(P)-binding domain-containing protein [Bacteroidota bacterium]